MQTGLITTGLALFGVYVGTSRMSTDVMEFYVGGYFPLGPWVVGTIAGSGYAIASYFSGIPVRRWLLALVLALQLGAFVGAHYSEFQTFDLHYRDSDEPVSFGAYFHYVSRTLTLPAGDDGRTPRGPRGYPLRALEAAVFSLGGLCSAFVLVGKPRCKTCGGRIVERNVSVVPLDRVPLAVKAIEIFARTGDLRRLDKALQPPEDDASDTDESSEPPIAAQDEVQLTLFCCSICRAGFIETAPLGAASEREGSPAAIATRIHLPPKHSETLFLAPTLFAQPQ